MTLQRHGGLQEPGAHPGPLVELDFWRGRADNLASIHEQLAGERIQKVVWVLELAQSTYHPAFQRLFKVSRRKKNRVGWPNGGAAWRSGQLLMPWKAW